MSMTHHLPYSTIQADLLSGKTTATATVQNYLKAIELKNTELNAFLAVFADEALQKAAEIDKKIANKEQVGKLAGMVIGIKDNLCYTGHRAWAASKILQNYTAIYSATAIERLVAEDAIIIGVQNCDEFGMGSSTENSAFGVTRNAANPNKVPGGSSGGSAVAVQAGMCHASIGTDTGGSVRQPAAFCGVVGLKPTYSRISRHGLIAYASSFDCVGTLTQNAADAALLMEVMAGEDDFDATVSSLPVPTYSQQLNILGKKKIAYLKEGLESSGVSQSVKKAFAATIEKLKKAGHEVTAIDIPIFKYVLPTYYILTTAEASSNLSRYDGVKYGYRTEKATDLETLYKNTRSEGFGKEVKRRIMLGTFVLSASYYDAFYTKAQKVRTLIKDATVKVLTEYDYLLMPTTPDTAFDLNATEKKDPIAMFLEDLFTVQANVAGVPAISIPVGKDEQGLPIGIQALANYFKEAELLALANELS